MVLVRNWIIAGNWFKRVSPFYQSRRFIAAQHFVGNDIIGDREIVGFGKNGVYIYMDDVMYPFPAIRYKEPSPELLCLREKERGDWRNLTLEEKKTLYRASFCLTYSEMFAPNAEWKTILGISFLLISLGCWFFILFRWLTYRELPDTFLEDRQAKQLKRMLTLEVGPVRGISSKWDYGRDRWK